MIPWIGLAAACSLMVLVWLASLARRDASIIDPFWGLGFVLLAWIYFVDGDGPAARRLLVALLVTLWGLRLSLHLWRRNRGKGEDYRYREMRQRWGDRFPWVSLFTVFLLQAVLLWVVALPLHQAARAASPGSLTWLDALGAVVFMIGFLFEAVGDHQLARFRADPANRGRVLDRGLWRYTRHPNYFGDALVWWGLFLIALATDRGAWTLLSPVLMTVLLRRVSGVSLLEKKLLVARDGYREYVERTNAFFPWFPRGAERR